MPKNGKEGTLWDFVTSILWRSVKKIEGGPFVSNEKLSEKVAAPKKKSKRGSLWSRPVSYVTFKKKKIIWVPLSTNLDALRVCRLVEQKSFHFSGSLKQKFKKNCETKMPFIWPFRFKVPAIETFLPQNILCQCYVLTQLIV